MCSQAAQWAALNMLCTSVHIVLMEFGSACADDPTLSELCAATRARYPTMTNSFRRFACASSIGQLTSEPPPTSEGNSLRVALSSPAHVPRSDAVERMLHFFHKFAPPSQLFSSVLSQSAPDAGFCAKHIDAADAQNASAVTIIPFHCWRGVGVTTSLALSSKRCERRRGLHSSRRKSR